MQQSRPIKSWILAAGGLVAGLAAVILIGLALRPHTFAGTLIQSAQPAFDFLLMGPEESRGAVERFRGAGGAVVLWLYLVPGRVPDHHERDGRDAGPCWAKTRRGPRCCLSRLTPRWIRRNACRVI